MANRFPLIVDSSALQIKELPSGDNIDLTGNSIVGVVDITTTGDVSIGGTLTYQDVSNVDSVGLITAREGISIGAGKSVGSSSGTVIYYGDGSNLSGLPQSGIGIQTAGAVGYGVTLLKFVGAAVSDFTTPHSGISTLTLLGGGGGGGGSISTAAATPSNAVVTLDLSTAQDHKITATGIVTVTTSGGTEGESHTVRIVNSGIATVGFSTYFLFPSGSSPILPKGTGDISLISFTVHRVGAAGTQLLAGSSLNFS